MHFGQTNLLFQQEEILIVGFLSITTVSTKHFDHFKHNAPPTYEFFQETDSFLVLEDNVDMFASVNLVLQCFQSMAMRVRDFITISEHFSLVFLIVLLFHLLQFLLKYF